MRALGVPARVTTLGTANASEEGKVVKTVPVAGTTLKVPGSSVELFIGSRAALRFTVPDVIGMTQAKAKAAMNAAGITPRFAEFETRDKSKDGPTGRPARWSS